MSASPPILRRVSEVELRALFNAWYAARLDAGEFVEVIERSGHPSPERSGQPFCTRSQYISYRERDGSRVFEGHRYLRPGGTIAGRHRLDPKWVYWEGVIYTQAIKQSPE
jgi:hypothetical protein